MPINIYNLQRQRITSEVKIIGCNKCRSESKSAAITYESQHKATKLGRFMIYIAIFMSMMMIILTMRCFVLFTLSSTYTFCLIKGRLKLTHYQQK